MKKEWALVGMIVVLMVLSVVFMMAKPEDVEERQKRLPKGNGAVVNVWLDTNARLDVLREHGVVYLFVDVGGTSPDGALNGSQQQMRHFLDLVKKYEQDTNYNFILLPYSEVRAHNIDVTSDFFKNNMIGMYGDLIRAGYDGILVDIEPIRAEQREEFLVLLDALRSGLPQDAIIAVYSGHVGNARNNEWMLDLDTYEQVVQRVDLISLPVYDTDHTDAEEYEDYVVQQVKLMRKFQEHADYLLAIPTHRPFPEESARALAAYREGIARYPNEKVLGVTLFAEWTAAGQDWENMKIFAPVERAA